jgi:hypothetical protein
MNRARLLRPAAFAGVLVLGLVASAFLEPGAGAPSSTPDVSFSVAELVRSMGPLLVALLAIALIAMTWPAGAAGLRAAIAFLVGREREADSELAWRALATAARATLAAGLLLGLLGAATMLAHAVGGLDAVPSVAPRPADLAQVFRLTIYGPLLALLLGRMVLGGCAAAVARRAGASIPFRRGADLALLSLVVPVALASMVVFMKYPKIH